ncbi:MAG: indole-3-glycerol phosphate synthase TrpC [Deltaproteobacteria bacterium]|nr:indole-3-glycerol phosphate synthase TrpC [Deltaproteobacteria bacterium]
MILDDIIKYKKEAVARSKAQYSIEYLRKKIDRIARTRDFTAAVSTKGGPDAIRIIAEIKRASPSKGILRQQFYPFEIARIYQLNGAAALSVLTEEKYFMGHLDFIPPMKTNLRLPVLRKDFILEEYQVVESRAYGADAVLLIAAILDKDTLKGLIELSASLDMAALVEVHDAGELDAAVEAGARIIGINNRDLKTFKTDISTTVRLAKLAPKDRIIVAESGINTFEDVTVLKNAGASAFLIGEALIREEDMGGKLKELMGIA